jgi:hypothetical protein
MNARRRSINCRPPPIANERRDRGPCNPTDLSSWTEIDEEVKEHSHAFVHDDLQFATGGVVQRPRSAVQLSWIESLRCDNRNTIRDVKKLIYALMTHL